MSGSTSSISTRPARVAGAQASPSTARLRPRLEFLMVGITPVTAILDAECTICTEPLIHDVVEFIKCGHVYHCVCILGWLKGSGTANRRCPVCRDVLFKAETPSLPHFAALPLHPGEIEEPYALIDHGGGTTTIGAYTIREETRAGPNHASQQDLPAVMPARAASDMLLGGPAGLPTVRDQVTGRVNAALEDVHTIAPSVALSRPLASQQSSTTSNGGPVTHPTSVLDEERADINAMHALIERASASLEHKMSEMILDLSSYFEQQNIAADHMWISRGQGGA